MKQKLNKLFQGNIFPVLLVILTIVLCILNFEPGTWLSGWDTLHPEFDIILNLKRAFFGVWQEHQGLGATASQAHPAEIPRIIILAFFSLIFPTSFLRYFYFFLCLIFGPLGVYFFLERIVLKNKSRLTKNSASFSGALFYLLNLGTLQHFYIPLEMFATQFASLGWLFLFATKFLETKNKKYFGLFSIATLLSTPMAHTATLFYAYALGFLIYILCFSFLYSPKIKTIFLKRGVILILATIVINSFWLLPNFYFVLNHGQEVVNSKIHRLFSNEAILQSKEFANIKDASVLKSFLFNWGELVGENRFDDLLDEWKLHQENPLVFGIGYFSFILVVLGLIFSLIKKNKRGLVFLPLFALAFFFVVILNPSLEIVYHWLVTNIPLLQEALRFPFTKFSILLMFCYALYFSLATSYLLNLLKKVIREETIVAGFFVILITAGLAFYMFPAFQGNLISPSMKIKIPDEYFQMFDWFNQQKQGRIAKLPIHTFWGWVYHDWGYQGAGFIWFGLKQPILDREFDRWSPYNEQYYQEMSYAIYSQNLPFLEHLLDKYQIRWLLLDESIIAPGNEKSVLFLKEIEEMFNSTEKVWLAKKFGDYLNVYQVNLETDFPKDQFVQLVETEAISPETEKEILGQMPSKLTPLIAYEASPEKVISLNLAQFQLFPELCSPQDVNQIFGLSQNNNSFRLRAKNSVACTKIPVSPILGKNFGPEMLIEVKFNSQSETDEKPLVCLFDNRLGRCAGQRFPDFYFELEGAYDNYQLQFLLDAVGSSEEKSTLYKNIELVIYEQREEVIIPTLIQEAGHFEVVSLSRKPESCTGGEPLVYERKIVTENGKRYLEYVSQKGSVCDHFNYPQLPHNQGYALIVESRNIEGLPLRLCLTNYQTRRCDFYVELPRSRSFQKKIYLIPPMGEEGEGYDVNLNNFSVGKTLSINHLKSIRIFPVNYDWIQLTRSYSKHNKVVVLNQAFEKNWLAFEYRKPFSIRPLKSHILINGWANGWLLEEEISGTIFFVFLPQLLEYFGFLLLFLFSCFTLIFLVKSK